MAADLQTRLGWIAVDQVSTGHPHSHILLRGVTGEGKILNIAGDYIAYGLRDQHRHVQPRGPGFLKRCMSRR